MTMCLLAVGALHAETFVMGELSGMPSEWGDFSVTFGTYTMSVAKNSGSSNPIYHSTAKDVRVYAKGSVQLVTTGDAMTQVVFNISDQGKKRLAEITPSVGSVTIDTEAWTVTWTGDSKDVTFTVGDKADMAPMATPRLASSTFCRLTSPLAARPWRRLPSPPSPRLPTPITRPSR